MGSLAEFINKYFGGDIDVLLDPERPHYRPVQIVSNQNNGAVSYADGLLYYRRNRFSTEQPPLPSLEGEVRVTFNYSQFDVQRAERRFIRINASRGLNIGGFSYPESVICDVQYVEPDFGFGRCQGVAVSGQVLLALGDRVGGGEPLASYLISLGDVGTDPQ